MISIAKILRGVCGWGAAMRHDGGHLRVVAGEPVDGVAGIPNLLHGEGLTAARDLFDRCFVCCRRWGKWGLRHGVRPCQWMWSGIFILVLALRSRRCNRRRGKQSQHSKRSEDMRPKIICHKRLQTGAGSTWSPQENCSAVLQLTPNSITIAGKFQAMEPTRLI